MTAAPLLTGDARRLARRWLQEWLPGSLAGAVSLGLPEWDERLECWRVALVPADDPGQPVGEIQLDRAGAIRRAPAPRRCWRSG